MPFANYRDFDDCVAKNRDKNDPGAYCAAVKNAIEKGEHHKKRKVRFKL